MKKILLFLSFLLMSVGMFSETIILTLSDFPSLSNSYSSGSITKNGITFYYNNFIKSNGNIQVKATSGLIYNSSSFPGNITQIKLIHSGEARSTTIYYGSTMQPSTNENVFSGSKTIDITGNNKYFKITRGSNAAYWVSIEITYENEISCDSISVSLYQTENGSAELNQNKICSGDEIEITKIIPDPGYMLDTIIGVNTSYSDTVGLVDMENHKITNITKECIVLVLFKPLPPAPEIEIVEWNPDYIKVDINNFNATTALLEDKDTQHTQKENVADKLFFSKYFEAKGNVKLWAVYNGTKDTVSLSDVRVVSSNNGSKWGKKIENQTVTDIIDNAKITSLASFGNIINGYILPNEEIILYNPGSSSTDNSIMACAKENVNFEQWESHVNQTTQISGDDGLILIQGSDTIDVIGGMDAVVAHNKVVQKSWNDDKGWWCENGEDANGNQIELSTNRCLLVRKNTVHSGLNAVATNTDNFYTLCDEWWGLQVAVDGDEIQESCDGFTYVGNYNYNEYYAQFTEIVSDTALSQIIDSDSTYKFTYDFTDLSCTELKVIVKDTTDKNDIKTHEETFRIPIFIYNDSTVKSFKEKNCNECDVVIIKGGKLTVNSELSNRDVTVYPGGLLVIPSDQTYNVNSLTLRRDNDSVPYFSYKGTLNTKKFNIDLRTNAEDWRWMTLPFAIHTDSIKLSNGKPINLNNNVWISYYDGKHRSIYQKNAWKDIYKDTVFNAGEGFLFGVDLPGQSKKIYRFSFNKEDSIEHEKSDKIIRNLYAWGGDNPNLAPNHKGWNLIGNPFMDSITSDIKDPIRIGRLKRDSVNGQWTGGWVVDSVTTKLRYAVIPNKDEEFADAGYYESVVLDDYVLKPLTSFFVQIGGNEDVMQTLTFESEKRTNRIVARKTPINERDEELFLRIKIGNKKTGCFISNHFNENYEPGDDLESRYAYYQLINGYKLLYSAINDSIIENGIQIHSLGGKVTLDPKVETEKFEQIYILYNNEWYDLLHGDEPEVSGDFVLYGKRKVSEDIPTDIGNIKPGQGTYKFLHENNIFINNKGKIYNIFGNKIH